MNRDEVRHLVREVLSEQEQRLQRIEEAAVDRAVRATLVSLGVIISPDASTDALHEQLERFRKNVQHVDKWRLSVERVERIGWGTAIAVIVSGGLGALLLGLKMVFGKG